DAVEVVFDGVLDGGDVHLVFVEGSEGGVEGGRLARAGRTRDKNDAVGGIDLLLPDLERGLVEAQVAELDVDGARVEDAHDDLLAVAHGEGRDAEVELASGDGATDAPVLGLAALGDVQVRHDLDAAGDRGGHGWGRVHHLEQHAVDAEADLELLL